MVDLIDPRKSISDRLGISDYLSIIEKVNQAKQKSSKEEVVAYLDKDFREMYCRYFKLMRLQNDDRDAYFEVFADLIWESSSKNFKLELFELSKVLGRLYARMARTKNSREKTKIQYSFATKMMACIDTSLPIWDSIVAHQTKINLNPGRANAADNFEGAVKRYHQLNDCIRDIELSDQMGEILKTFNALLGVERSQEISDFKKIDFCIWWNREK